MPRTRGRRRSESNALSERQRVEGPALERLITPTCPEACFFVYILHCSDGSYYVGHTQNLPERVRMHNEGRGAQWTACRRPAVLVFQESFHTEQEAIRREIQLKGWTRAKKRALITRNLTDLKAYAKRRSTMREQRSDPP